MTDAYDPDAPRNRVRGFLSTLRDPGAQGRMMRQYLARLATEDGPLGDEVRARNAQIAAAFARFDARGPVEPMPAWLEPCGPPKPAWLEPPAAPVPLGGDILSTDAPVDRGTARTWLAQARGALAAIDAALAGMQAAQDAVTDDQVRVVVAAIVADPDAMRVQRAGDDEFATAVREKVRRTAVDAYLATGVVPADPVARAEVRWWLACSGGCFNGLSWKGKLRDHLVRFAWQLRKWHDEHHHADVALELATLARFEPEEPSDG